MAKLSSMVYLLIGLFVLVVSFTLDWRRFLIFIVVGVVFFAIGIIKLVAAPGKAKVQLDDTDRLHHYQQKMPPTDPRDAQVRTKVCHNCGAAAMIHARYCWRCGSRMH